jgi:hypothetical protein
MPASDQQSRNDMPIKLKKAPDAPKRFKSAFIFFSTEKHKEIRSQLMAEGNTEKVTPQRAIKLPLANSERSL